MTGILQKCNGKFKNPLDKCMWNVKLREMQVSAESPEVDAFTTGILKGYCRSLPKQLYDILNSEQISSEKTPKDHYAFPLYKTYARRSVFMTTGHSTNFVTPNQYSGH